MMKPKKGFTIVEGLISMLIISVIGVGMTFLLNSYYKTTYSRDLQLKDAINNMNIIEQIKANVNSIRDLYNFTNNNGNIRIIAVGIGEVSLSKKANGDITITKSGLDESYVFNDKLKINQINIFRLEVGGTTPNSSLSSIILVRR